MRDTVGQNIRAQREKLGWTLAELAERMFNDRRRQSYISSVENGHKAIDVDRLADFAHALNCPAGSLLLTMSYEETA